MYTRQPKELTVKFKRIFKLDLHQFWSPVFGFNLVGFETQYPTRDGESLKDEVFEKHGADGVSLIMELIDYPLSV